MEYKFRGQRKDDGNWIYGDLIHNPEYEYPLIGFDCLFLGDSREIPPYNKYVTYEVIPESVGQFTGLTDRNGKEIYDGDILRWFISSTNTFAEELLEVKWGRTGWILKSPLFKRWGIKKEDAECSEYNAYGFIIHSEIIGDKHQNPELMEGI